MEVPKEETEVKSEEKAQEPIQEKPAPAAEGVRNLMILIRVEEQKEKEEDVPSKEVESAEEKPVEEDEESLVMACE